MYYLYLAVQEMNYYFRLGWWCRDTLSVYVLTRSVANDRSVRTGELKLVAVVIKQYFT